MHSKHFEPKLEQILSYAAFKKHTLYSKQKTFFNFTPFKNKESSNTYILNILNQNSSKFCPMLEQVMPIVLHLNILNQCPSRSFHLNILNQNSSKFCHTQQQI